MARPASLLTASLLSSLLALPATAQEGRWYAGDLHAHSLHSDGDSPLEDLISRAETVGLDFFVVTDHDSSMGGETPHWFDPAYRSDELILLYGVEWTTGKGHANIWAPGPFDYRPLWAANLIDDPWAAASAAHAQGALFSINHPTNYLCCPWDPDDGMNDAVEVWNGFHRVVTWDGAATRRFWEASLLAGRDVTAVGGSDTHYLANPLASIYNVGNPTTWVYAFAATPAGILEGIAAGRVSIAYGPEAPRVELWGDGDLDGTFETAMGESLPAGEVRLRVHIGDGAGRVERLPLAAAKPFFGGELSAMDLARFKRLTKPTACGRSYVAGLYEGESLVESARVGCGGAWEIDVTARPGTFYRVEVLGDTQVKPRQQPAYGYYVGLTNVIRVE